MTRNTSDFFRICHENSGPQRTRVNHNYFRALQHLGEYSSRRRTMQRSLQRLARGLRSLLALAAAALLLSACSGGGGSSDTSASNNGVSTACADCGTLLIGLTDADGDFVSYSVDVLSIKLKRPD